MATVNWRVLWQIANSGTLYTVPQWFTTMVSEFFIVNIHATATQTYTINVVKRWWTVLPINILAHDVQIQPWYFGDRLPWLNMVLADWDSIVVGSSWNVVFQVFWYESAAAQSAATGGSTWISALASFMAAIWQ